MPTQCSDISSLIQTYLDGELADRDLHDFESHVAGCGECDQALSTERSFHRLIRSELLPPPAPDVLRRRLDQALDADDQQVDSAARRARWGWVLPGSSIAAAAAALVLFVTDSLSPAGPPAVSGPQIAEGSAHRVAVPVRVTPMAPTPVVKSRGQAPADDLQLDADNLSRAARSYIGVPVELPSFAGLRVTLRYSQAAAVFERRAWVFFYDVETTRAVHPMALYMLDARGLETGSAERRVIDGREVGVVRVGRDPGIIYRSARGVGYMFTGHMSEETLIDVVANSGLPLD